LGGPQKAPFLVPAVEERESREEVADCIGRGGRPGRGFQKGSGWCVNWRADGVMGGGGGNFVLLTGEMEKYENMSGAERKNAAIELSRKKFHAASCPKGRKKPGTGIHKMVAYACPGARRKEPICLGWE